ncbi:MAG TPA: SMI1/KNR4 family protein [Gemmatimonadales bacterium]|nr:SMI1/KNR4 family protein [Gemmatimonadales bacterium]
MSGFYEPPPIAGSPFRTRLFHPQWSIIEAALGRPVPGVLRDLYAAPERLLRSHFYCTSPDGTRRAWVDLFLPLDDEALRPYGRTLPPGAIAFADDEHGDPYYFVPDGSPYGDGPVYVLPSHGESGGVRVADSLADMLGWARTHGP